MLIHYILSIFTSCVTDNKKLYTAKVHTGMYSMVLVRERIKHSLDTTPGDGDCFYNAFIKATSMVGKRPKHLRQQVLHNMSQEESELSAAITSESIHTRWADELDISIMMRRYPSWTLVIVDDDFECICRIQNGRHVAFLHRSNDHYTNIILEHSEKKKIFDLLENETYVRCQPQKGEIDIDIVSWSAAIIVINLLKRLFSM